MRLLAVHITRTEDTLPRIAALFYSRWDLYYLIFDANRDRLIAIDNIKPGQPLQIPDPRTEPTEHTVAAGDSVESLADLYYGCEHFAGRIQNANEDKLICESIGETWTIPALVSRPEIEAATRRRAA